MKTFNLINQSMLLNLILNGLLKSKNLGTKYKKFDLTLWSICLKEIHSYNNSKTTLILIKKGTARNKII